MNNLVNVTSHKVETMSSREIAELTGKTVNHVHRDIARMLEQIEHDPNLDHLIERDNRGYIVQYNLPRRECEILVTGYDVVRRAAVIDRWMMLEKKQAPALPDFTNPAEAARAWAAEFEQKQIALEKIEADKPKVEFAESISSSVNSFDLSEASKRLKVKGLGPNKLRAWLRQNGVLMRDNKPYQKFMDGRFEIETRVRTNIDGEKESYFVTMITPRGFIWLERVVRKHWKK